ncbi:hypothetical protein DDB_G0273029 [Dictyostelium discoideum AX4]|uniref:Uncharacterized protein n=1 Tax=Dictyostelium discoideum TaxID=44689 RepID=Q556G8_DICDI|nr:hypothetical protein DDB_G0274071 [Dictyostelium discoideum AX4]XP_645019.1 hypothetical protein DDB_G0273029 [Dictyostelium discoideum AX4]EAL70469.1 hypothetical protein DDB_G0274071 [Dictyostelium discoideum AX4]EAL71152.1 hypothetical protein DDB_G0273029 [Dictyostelium discoideum AX4]|eukprot:XP_644394.1 hypothetical protein DDB_G0274071 [Dictyostelium discoideum AX4]
MENQNNISIQDVMSKPTESETSFTSDFKKSLKNFGVSDQGISLLDKDDDLFKRFVTRDEIEKQNAFLLKQGDYFTKSVELEEENIFLKEKIEKLEKEIQIQNEIILKLRNEKK